MSTLEHMTIGFYVQALSLSTGEKYSLNLQFWMKYFQLPLSGWSFSVLCHVWILVVFLSLRSFVSKSSPFRELASIFFHSYSYVMARFQQWRIWRSITIPGDVLPWRTGNYWCPRDTWDVGNTLQNGILPLLQIIHSQKPIMRRLRSLVLGQYF